MSALSDYPFVSHWLTVGGHRLHYIDEGEGEPLVFLHGNPTWSYYWRHLLRELSSRYRVIAPDHIGCGLSDKPQDYDYRLETHIGNLTALLDHLEVRGVTLLVHDWGGAIGMGYATRAPQNVTRLVVFNTAAFTSDDMPPLLSLARVPGLGKLAIRGFNAFARGATRLATTKGLAPDVRAAYVRPYDSYRNRIATYEFVQDIPLTPRHPSYETLRGIEEGLSKLRGRPMLLLWGKRDWVFHSGFLHEWRWRFPEAEAHLFEDAGHYVVEDARDRVIPLVSDFLERTACPPT